MDWTIDDVLNVATTVSLLGQTESHCGFCGTAFLAERWIAVTVAHESRGGTVIDLCSGCARDLWPALIDRMAKVAEAIAAAETAQR